MIKLSRGLFPSKLAIIFCLSALVVLSGCSQQSSEMPANASSTAQIAGDLLSQNETAESFIINPISDIPIESLEDLEQLGCRVYTGSYTIIDMFDSAETALFNINVGTINGQFRRVIGAAETLNCEAYLLGESFSLAYPEAIGSDINFGYDTYMTQNEFDFLVLVVKSFVANPDNPFINCVPEKLAGIAAENRCYFTIETGESHRLNIVSRDHPNQAIYLGVNSSDDTQLIDYIYSKDPKEKLASRCIMDGYENEYFDAQTLYWHLSDAYIDNVIEPALTGVLEGDHPADWPALAWNDIVIGDLALSYMGYNITKDAQGNDVIIVFFDCKNTGASRTSFLVTVANWDLHQAGGELRDNLLPCDKYADCVYYTDSLQRQLEPGQSAEAALTAVLSDTSSHVNVVLGTMTEPELTYFTIDLSN